MLATARGRTRPLLDRVYDTFALLAAPTPHLIRAIAASALAASVVAAATVASADALPAQPLYAVKLAAEEVRLGLADGAADRAAVELSLAEHRLAEAEQLALAGRDDDALIAGASYGAHLAQAAAELATIERDGPAGQHLADQLTRRLADQQRHAAGVAERSVADGTGALAPVFRAVASTPPSAAPAGTISEAVAVHAAAVAGHVADAAEAPRADHEAAGRVRHEVDKARDAAEKAKEAAKHASPAKAAPKR